MAAEMGNLTDKDKVKIVLLKVQGAHPECKADITYARLKALLLERFKEKHSYFYHYSQLQGKR